MNRIVRPTWSLAAVFVLAAWAAVSPARAQGTFTRTGDAVFGRNLAVATLLSDARVLVTGGTRTGDSGAVFNREAEIYDPAAGTFAATGPMSVGRINHAVAPLNDGRVLIVGGTSDGTNAIAVAELFDPAAGEFRVAGNTAVPRNGATATRLKDGRVLIVGGVFARGDSLFLVLAAEIFDPATGAFAVGSNIQKARVGHEAITLPDGRVLIIGGLGPDPLGPGLLLVKEIEAYDPATGAFTTIGELREGRQGPEVTLLPDGKVLISGGLGLTADQQAVTSNTLEVFDPATGTSSAPVAMSGPRRNHVAVALTDGRVLLAGGTTPEGNGQSTASAELFDPAAGTTTPIGTMTEPRTQAAAVRLQDGSVLIVGGARIEGGRVTARLRSAEIYKP